MDPFDLFRQAQVATERLLRGSMLGFDEDYECSAYHLNWTPSVDVIERPDRFVIQAELPGTRREDIELQLASPTMLHLSGERKLLTPRAPDERMRVCEQRWGRFFRSVQLPPTADTASISATHDNGVLEVTVPKKEVPERPAGVRIPIRTT